MRDVFWRLSLWVFSFLFSVFAGSVLAFCTVRKLETLGLILGSFAWNLLAESPLARIIKLFHRTVVCHSAV